MIVPTRLRDYIASLDPEESYKIIRFDPSDRKPADLACCKTVEYEDDSGLYHLGVDQPAISSVVIKLNAGTVLKTVSTFSEFNLSLIQSPSPRDS